MNDLVDGIADELLRELRCFVAAERLPGAAAGVATRDGLVWSAGCGFADLETGRRPDADTLYRIASNTKVFTAIGIMQLRDEGRLRLDDPLVAHLPEFAAAGNPFGPLEDVTLRRLLMHESGLQGEHPVDDPTQSAMLRGEQVLARLGEVRVAIPPSSAAKYSNLGFDLLGEVVARYNGCDFEEALQRRLLRPLGMASTTCFPVGDAAARRAVAYRARACSDALQPAPVYDPHLMPGSGMLWSSVADLARFIAFALTADARSAATHPVLSPRTLAEMQACRILSDDVPPVHQGLAWYSIRSEDGTEWVGHAGGWECFITRTLFSVKDGVGAIVLLNGIGDVDKAALRIAELWARALRARPPADRAAAPPAPPPDEVAALLGTYEDGDGYGALVRVEWRDGSLALVDEEAVVYGLESAGDPLVRTVRGGRWSGEAARFLRAAPGADAAAGTDTGGTDPGGTGLSAAGPDAAGSGVTGMNVAGTVFWRQRLPLGTGV